MQFTHPLHDPLLTRGFAFLSSLYVGGQHAAVDYVRRSGPTRGAPIKVMDGGKVVGNGWDFYSGFFVAVDHTGGWRSFYRHLIERSRLAIGTLLAQDQMIGNVGNTGVSQGDHLHFDLWNREKKDPTAFYKNGWWAHDPELYLDIEQALPAPEEEDDMVLPKDVGVIIISGDGGHYFVSLIGGYRTHLAGKAAWLFIHQGVPTMRVGEPGAPENDAALWGIPSLEEL